MSVGKIIRRGFSNYRIIDGHRYQRETGFRTKAEAIRNAKMRRASVKTWDKIRRLTTKMYVRVIFDGEGFFAPWGIWVRYVTKKYNRAKFNKISAKQPLPRVPPVMGPRGGW